MTQRVWTIYCITNTINCKLYIGQSVKGAERRFYEHVYDAKMGYMKCPHLYSAIRKYGSEHFAFKTLFFVNSQQKADELEIDLIAKYETCKNGYNVALGGAGGMLGHKHSEKSRKRMSERQMGSSNYWYGVKQPQEMVEKRSNSNRGKKRSGQALQNIREANSNIEKRTKSSNSLKGKPLSESHKQNIKKANARPDVKEKQSRGHKGKHLSQETKDKIGIASRNRLVSDETRKKISESNKIAQNRPDVQIKRSNSLKGQKRTIEQIKKMSEAQNRPEVLEHNRQAQKGRKKSELEIQHIREALNRPEVRAAASKRSSGVNNSKFRGAVNQYTKNLIYVTTYTSLSEASKTTKVSIGNMSSTCRGERPFAGGFIWRYASDCDPITHMPS